MEIFLIIILLVRFNSKSILLSNINNLLYFNISLGNPSQNINLLVDINSDKTIILGNQDNYKNIPNSFKFNAWFNLEKLFAEIQKEQIWPLRFKDITRIFHSKH